MTRLALALAATLALGGCALGRSPVATTWVLDPVAARGPAAEPPAGAGLLCVERVRVPDWLDRPQFVVRGAGGRVELDERARWAEPLGRGLQRVIAENLAALLPDRRVAAAPVPPRHAVAVRLGLDFVDASRQPDGSVRVEVRWEFTDKERASLRRGLSVHGSRAVAPGPAGTVAALDEALAALAAELAEALRGATAG
jgi:uncharacterized lipoprotein YmbA